MITKEMYLLARRVIENYENQTMNLPRLLPQLFKNRRKFLKMSIKKVAENTGVNTATIWRVENGGNAFFKTIFTLDEFYTKKENE